MTIAVGFAEVKVEVAGLQVTAAGYLAEGADQHDRLRAFNWHAGTRVGLLVTSSDKTIVGLKEGQSKIETMTDDQGTDFFKAKGRFGRKSVELDQSSESDDGKALLIHVESAGIPKKGAKTLTMKGELVVSLASKSKLIKSDLGALEKGGKLVVGDHAFKLVRVAKPSFGDDPLEIRLESSVSHKDFKGFHFYDVEGNEIESDRRGSGSMGMLGKRTYSVSFSLKKKVDQIVLGLDTWTDLEVVKLPLDFKIGAGL